MNRKQELINFIKCVKEGQLVGVYYLDKPMGIVHFFIYSYQDLEQLLAKIKPFNNQLDDDFIKILLWKASDSEEYLSGVYDGLVKNQDGQNVDSILHCE